MHHGQAPGKDFPREVSNSGITVEKKAKQSLKYRPKPRPYPAELPACKD